MRVLTGLLVTAGVIILAVSASAYPIAFEWTEGANSIHQSIHQGGGPVLVDDFTPARYGKVVSVEWWGSATNGLDWEITFHPDVGGTPDTAPPTAIIDQQFVTALGLDPDGDGIFHYSALWPGTMTLFPGQDYWFSVASGPWPTQTGAPHNGWTWALPGTGPTEGSEQYDAAVSNPGGGVSPHFGPWWHGVGLDFAFRINVVPEPSTVAIFGLGLGGLALLIRRRRTRG